MTWTAHYRPLRKTLHLQKAKKYITAQPTFRQGYLWGGINIAFSLRSRICVCVLAPLERRPMRLLLYTLIKIRGKRLLRVFGVLFGFGLSLKDEDRDFYSGQGVGVRFNAQFFLSSPHTHTATV